jgi:hypothetical protein
MCSVGVAILRGDDVGCGAIKFVWVAEDAGITLCIGKEEVNCEEGRDGEKEGREDEAVVKAN